VKHISERWSVKEFDESQTVVIADLGPTNKPLVAVCTGENRKTHARLISAAPIAAELAEAVLAFADPQNMGFKEPPLPRFNLDQWWRIVALARKFQNQGGV